MAEPIEEAATVADDTKKPAVAQTETPQPSAGMKEPVVTQEPTGSQEKVQTEEPVVTQEPTDSQEKVQTEEPVVTQEPTSSLEKKEDQIKELTDTQEPESLLVLV